MFFDDLSEIERLAGRSGCSVFVVPAEMELGIRDAIVISPEDGRRTISIEQVRDVMATLVTKQTADRYIIIRPAETLGEEAENAILKNLEEPQEKVHFVLVTESLSALLPTILSRAAVYILRRPVDFDTMKAADEKLKALARRLVTAKPAEVVAIADEIAKKKDGVRAHAMGVLEVAIEMLYKSYFKTGKMIFVQKLPKFLAAYEGISRNGHVKLQIVANLI